MTSPASPSPPPPPEKPPAAPPAGDFLAADFRLGVVQHILFWAGYALAALVAFGSLRNIAWTFEVYGRQNMLLPSADLLFRNYWYFTYPAAAAWLACGYLRLRRMADWREAGRRPPRPRWVTAYLAFCAAALAVPAALVWAEQFLLMNPASLGDARLRLPAGGAYLTQRVEDADTGIYDYSDPETAFRYKPNLNLPAFTAGDILEGLGGEHLAGRLPYRRVVLRTDADGFIGFAGAGTADGSADIVAAGDSFTAGQNVPARTAWPHRLAQATGRPVYNMGVLGAGPQQEFRLFRRFAPARKPKVAVWCFFEANDIYDAVWLERYFSRYAGRGLQFDQVRQFPDPRFAKRYQCSALRAWWLHLWDSGATGGSGANSGSGATGGLPAGVGATGGSGGSAGPDDWDDGPGGPPELPAGHVAERGRRYDTGAILPNRRWEEVPYTGLQSADRLNPVEFRIGDKRMEMSIHYYRDLTRTADQWTRDEGWPPFVRTVREFGDYCRAHGIRLLLVYAPCKANVYWEWLADSPSEKRLSEICRPVEGGIRAAIDRNRLVLRELVQQACADAGVEFLDLTPALHAEAAKGRYVYLHHDTHWSPAGHQVVADAVAARLALPAK